MKIKDLLLMFMLALIWGGSFSVIKVGLLYVDPVLFSILRSATASLVLLALTLPRGIRLGNSRIRDLVLLGLLNTTVFTISLTFSTAYAQPGLASILIYTQVLITPILSSLFLGEHLGSTKYLGIAVGFAGTILVVGAGKSSLLGIIAGLVGSLSWSAVNVLYKVVGRDSDELAIATMQSIIGTVLMLPLVPLGGLRMEFTVPLALSIAYQGVLVAGVGYVVWFRLLRRYSASIVSSTSMMVPAIALILSWILLGEEVTWPQMLGEVLIALGIYLVMR